MVVVYINTLNTTFVLEFDNISDALELINNFVVNNPKKILTIRIEYISLR